MNIPTRLRILEYLKKQHAASADELGLALGMTRANVRHHLVALETNELVEIIGQYREGRGRPRNIYGISRRVLGDGLAELSSALLFDCLGEAPEELQNSRLESLAVRINGNFKIPSEYPLQRRLTGLIHRMNELHYQSRWEAGASGARIVLGHCPFSAIIEGHPELCRLDAIVLEKQLPGHQVKQVSKLEKTGLGYPQCVFSIG